MGRILMATVALTLPFSIDAFGKISTTTDPSIIWKDRVKTVLATMVTERIMRDSFGTEIAMAIFEGEQLAQGRVKSEIGRAFARDLPALTLNTVDVSYEEASSQIQVSVVYTLPNNEVQETSYGYVSISGTNPLTEEIV